MEVVEFEKDELIRWVHCVEYNKPVRMAGLITELYFSKKLNDAQSSGKFSCIAEGWFYTTPLATDISVRYWCRLAEQNSKLSAVEQAFIGCLSTIGHRFFFLQWDIRGMEGNEQAHPEITIAATEWLVKHEKFLNEKTLECDILQERINGELHAYLSEVSFDPKRGWNVNLPFSKWLLHVETGSLASLFVQRSLMNSSVVSKPLDLDAMALSGDGGSLVFLEFKRKYPTTGGSRPMNAQDRAIDYFALANEMKRALRDSPQDDFDQAKQSFNEECRKRQLRYVRVPSFGLDMHHFETVMLCDQMGIEYRYVIWDAGQSESKDSRSLSVTLDVLEKLLTREICCVQTPKWWVKSLSTSDVKGLTFTFGNDSGSYSKKIRLQVIIDAES